MRRSRAPTSPGRLHASTSLRMRSRYAGGKRRRSTFAGTSGSGSLARDPVTGRFIRTLKENVLWIRSFETIEELRLALIEFKRTYNEHWMLEKYDYRSPAQVRRDLLGLDAAA